MRANFCVFAALAVGASVARATGGGGGIGVGTRGLQAIADAIEPTLVAEIRALKVPDVKTNAGGFKVHLFDMHVGSFQCDSPCIVPTFDAGGAIGLKLPGFHIVFHLHGRFTKFGVTLGTVCNSNIGTGHLSASGKVAATNATLGFSGASASADVGHFDPRCNGIAGGIIGIISSLFDSTIKHQINEAIKQQITRTMQTEANKILSSISWHLPLEPGVASVDFSPVTVASTPEHLSLVVRAAVVNPEGDLPPVPTPSLPTWSADAAGAYLQILLSSWALDSYGFTYWKAGRLKDHITHDQIGPKSPIQLNTSRIGLFAPGLLLKYPHHWMTIDTNVTATPTVVLEKTSGATAHAPATFVFNVVNSSGGVIDTAFIVSVQTTSQTPYSSRVRALIGAVPWPCSFRVCCRLERM